MDLVDRISAYNGTHPPYLACVSTHVDGLCIQQISATSRSLARFHSIKPDKSADLTETYLGIGAANWGYVVLNASGRAKKIKYKASAGVIEFLTFIQENAEKYEGNPAYLDAYTLLQNYTGTTPQCKCTRKGKCSVEMLCSKILLRISEFTG